MKQRRYSGLAFLLLLAIVCGVGLAACGGSSDSGSSSESGSATGSEGETSEGETSEGEAGAETAAGGQETLEGQTVTFANYTDAAPLFVTMREGVKKAAEVVGAEVELYDNKAEGQETLQNAQLMANKEPALALEFNPVQGTATAVEGQFESKGIPCISVNIEGAGYCPWIDLNNLKLAGDSARVVAKEAQAKDWNGEDTTVILVQAAAAGAAVNTVMGFFYEVLQEELPGLSKIGSWKDIKTSTTTIGDSGIQVDGQALRQPSFENVSSALQGVPPGNHLIIYTVGDESALGAYTAAQRAGRADDLLIAGLGGSAEGLKQLRTNPSWVAEGDIFYPFWGQYLMAMGTAIINGEETPEMTDAPIAVLTKNLTIKGTGVVPVGTYYKPNSTLAYQLPPLEPMEENVTSAGKQGTVGNQYLAATGVLQKFENVVGLK